MTGRIDRWERDGCGITVYVPSRAEEGLPALYVGDGGWVSGDAGLWNALTEAAEAIPCLLAAVEPRDRDADYTPWPAPPLKAGESPFAGRAEEYLAFLTGRLLPELEDRYPFADARRRGLMGYSLGGLFTLYALYRTDAFCWLGCLSGSLWYEEWTAYMAAHQPADPGTTVYLSLGQGEHRSRHPRLGAVYARTLEARALLEKQLTSSPLWEEPPGGHFADMPGRFVRAVSRFGPCAQEQRRKGE